MHHKELRVAMDATLLPNISRRGGWGGIATNDDGSLFANVESYYGWVHIYTTSAAGNECTAVFSTEGQLRDPRFICFACRRHAETLLIADAGHDQIVEITTAGKFIRAIATSRTGAASGYPLGIAYCAYRDVIAVSLYTQNVVVLMQYGCGSVIARIGERGQFHNPMGLRFTRDGLHIVVADSTHHRVSKFNVTTGAFVAHITSQAAHGTRYPCDVLQCEDGTVMVAQRRGVHCVGLDGTVQTTGIMCDGISLRPRVLAYCTQFGGLIVKEGDGEGVPGGRLALLNDHWRRRFLWVSLNIRL